VGTGRERIFRGLGIATVVALILYVFAPGRTQPGTVKPIAERNPMPDFTFPDMEGQPWSLKTSHGKILLVNFWATWCGPCREETPALVGIANRYRARNFEVIGVTLDEDPDEVVPAFLKEFRVNYPILVPSQNSALAAGIETIPTSVLLDKQGRIARTYVGVVRETQLARDVETLLAE
jgi:thiol-disulfide isomerase/thioredoxin